MKRVIGRTLIAMLLLTGATLFGYFWYVRITAPAWIQLGGPVTVMAIFAVGILIDYFVFRDYRNPGPADVQFQVRPPAPKAASPAIQSVFTAFALVLMTFFGLYWRHTFYASEKTLLIDAWWPVILPVATGLAALVWLIDTLFMRIINGSHSKRPMAALRVALIAKRVAVAAAGFGIAYWIGISHMPNAQDAYRAAPMAIAWLASVAGLAGSLVIIRR